VGQDLVEVGAGLGIGLAVGFSRQLGKLLGRGLAELRIEVAVVGEQQGCLRGVVLEQAQVYAQHGQGLEHRIQ